MEKLNKNFDDVITTIQLNKFKVHGVELYHQGTVLQTFGNTTSRYPIYSATKTILSLAVGIALEQGKLNLNTSILDYLPEKYLNQISSMQKVKFQNITIERLLTMSVKAFPFRPAGDDWLLFSLNQNIGDCPLNRITENCPLNNTIGDRPQFNYSNICSYLISVALSEVTQMNSFDFIDSRILSPLEIPTPIHQNSPEGYFVGSSSLELSVQELSKIGQLIMNNGFYNGNQIVPEKYIQQAVSTKIMNKEGGYGYFIWRFGEGFSINGKWGQKCYCMPNQQLMLTFLSDMQDGYSVLKEKVNNIFCNNWN